MPRDMVQVKRGKTKSYDAPEARIRRSQFNRTHGVKMTFDASYLVPFYTDEVLPGDTFTVSLDGFARIFSPLDAPVMDNIEIETFFFYCPTRLLWENWAFFNGEHNAAGAQDTDYTIPIMASGMTVDHDASADVNQLGGYLGLPQGLVSGTTDVSALLFRMYSRVYSEWFRDQNLTGRPTLEVDNGPDTPSIYTVRTSAKKHDYFTSALPYLQKGDPVAVALTADADVFTDVATGANPSVWSTANTAWRQLDSDSGQVDLSSSTSSAASALYADLTGVAGVTINALRESVAIQRLLEKDARGGTRYTEMIKAHFGVTSPDSRLQRPEYLGGGKSFINVTAVANTSDTAGADQGELRGVGTGVIRGHGWAKSFTEHGYIIGLVRARGDLTYFQGLDRMWTRSTRYDFYLPALANLGEQSILNKELFVQNAAADDLVFGYQERWAEYRMKQSRVAGKFNPDVSGALSHWHLAEDFAALPTLSTAFIWDSTPMSRITTVDTEPHFLLDLIVNLKCARPMPVYSIPSLTNRF